MQVQGSVPLLHRKDELALCLEPSVGLPRRKEGGLRFPGPAAGLRVGAGVAEGLQAEVDEDLLGECEKVENEGH